MQLPTLLILLVQNICKNEDLVALLEDLKEGAFIKVKGIIMFDSYDKEVSVSSIVGIMKHKDFRKKRADNSVEKE